MRIPYAVAAPDRSAPRLRSGRARTFQARRSRRPAYRPAAGRVAVLRHESTVPPRSPRWSGCDLHREVEIASAGLASVTPFTRGPAESRKAVRAFVHQRQVGRRSFWATLRGPRVAFAAHRIILEAGLPEWRCPGGGSSRHRFEHGRRGCSGMASSSSPPPVLLRWRAVSLRARAAKERMVLPCGSRKLQCQPLSDVPASSTRRRDPPCGVCWRKRRTQSWYFLVAVPCRSP